MGVTVNQSKINQKLYCSYIHSKLQYAEEEIIEREMNKSHGIDQPMSFFMSVLLLLLRFSLAII